MSAHPSHSLWFPSRLGRGARLSVAAGAATVADQPCPFEPDTTIELGAAVACSTYAREAEVSPSLIDVSGLEGMAVACGCVVRLFQRGAITTLRHGSSRCARACATVMPAGASARPDTLGRSPAGQAGAGPACGCCRRGHGGRLTITPQPEVSSELDLLTALTAHAFTAGAGPPTPRRASLPAPCDVA